MSLRAASRPSKYICKACRTSLSCGKRRKYGTNSITTNPSPEAIYDVVTVGGGPVGLSLLTALRSSPKTSHLKCLLVESQSLSKQKSWDLPADTYSNRASSITPTNQEFVEQLGVWRCLNLSRVQPYDEMQVWDAANDASIQFDWKAEAMRYNAPLRTVATMVENSNLVRAFLRRLEELEMETDFLMEETRVMGIGNGIDDPEGLDLTTWPVLQLQKAGEERTQQIAARLLVGADGINSPVRTFAGINTNGWDYGRHGVVATLKLESNSDSPFASSSPGQNYFDSALEDFLSDDKDGQTGKLHEKQNASPSNRATAYQRFLPSLGGPIAILPLPNDHASLVWSTNPKVASYLKSLSPSAFVSTVNAALRLDEVDIKYMVGLESAGEVSQHESELQWRLSHTSPPPISRAPPVITGVEEGSVASFPLRLRNATSYTAPRIALAGDAAHTIHPLAGQGLNLGLGDTEALARIIGEVVERGGDIGDTEITLAAYGRERYVKGVEMGTGVDLLSSIYQFGTSEGMLGTLASKARGLGMWMVGQVPGLKEGIMRRAG